MAPRGNLCFLLGRFFMLESCLNLCKLYQL